MEEREREIHTVAVGEREIHTVTVGGDGEGEVGEERAVGEKGRRSLCVGDKVVEKGLTDVRDRDTER